MGIRCVKLIAAGGDLQQVEIEPGARSDSHHAHTDREREHTLTREVG